MFGKKRVLLHPIVQAICLRKPVESLNSCQTIARQKRRIFPSTGNMLQEAGEKYYCTGIEQNNLSNII
jgi:hypothetical protein